MDNQRRDFIRHSGILGGAFFLAEPLNSLDSFSPDSFFLKQYLNEIAIIHTNDLHNRIGPVQVGKRNGYGGLKNIEAHLEKSASSHLLVDAGDFLDETAGFSQHRQMITYMNRLGYKAATIGNRELAKGPEYFAMLMDFMRFPVVNCNYQFDHPYLKENIKPFAIIKSGKFKIGITGVGVKQANHQGWLHPYDCANEIAINLKQRHQCDLVLCLSHLGFEHANSEPSNLEFARASESIDIIIGGHGNMVSPGLMVYRNKFKHEVMVSHGGPEGILIKKITIGFSDLHQKNKLLCNNIVPGAQEGSSGYLEIKRITA